MGHSVHCRAMNTFQDTYTGVKCFVYKFTLRELLSDASCCLSRCQRLDGYDVEEL